MALPTPSVIEPNGPCGPVTPTGFCDGERLLRCVSDQLAEVDCRARGLSCRVDAEGADCVEPASGVDASVAATPDAGACSADAGVCSDPGRDSPAVSMPPEPEEVPAEPKPPLEPSTSLARAYQRLVRLQCELEQRCFPVGTLFFGTESTEHCVEPLEELWRWEASLPDNGITLERVDECAESLNQSDCDDAELPKSAGPPCWYPGARGDGEPCISDTQCDSGWCQALPFSCGQCAPYPTAGTPCSLATDCPDGLRCSNGECVSLGLPGDSCDSSSPCYDWVDCIDGTCRERDRKFGETCGSSIGESNCDINGNPLRCDFETKVCSGVLLCSLAVDACVELNVPFARPGDECPMIGCTQGAACIEGVCMLSGAGEACGGEAGPCAWPLACVDGTCRGVPSSYECDGVRDAASPEPLADAAAPRWAPGRVAERARRGNRRRPARRGATLTNDARPLNGTQR